MKIATFNINGINARLPVLLAWLAAEQPDVVCLQELKAPDSAFPEAAINEAGYGAIWQGQKAWNGVAMLARGDTPTESRRGLPGGEADTHSRYLEAAVNGMLIASLYLPNGNPQPGPKFDYKLAGFERLNAHAATLMKMKEPVVLAGDFNVVPSDDVADIYNPASWKTDALLQPESRAAYQRLLKQGWMDAIAKRHPGQPMYTFWDYSRNRWPRNAGLRIDHLLLNASAVKRLDTAGVDRALRGAEKASDHAPAWVTLRD